MVEFWSRVQSQIFTGVAVGRGNATIKCVYEKADGIVVEIPLGETVKYLLEDTVNRIR